MKGFGDGRNVMYRTIELHLSKCQHPHTSIPRPFFTLVRRRCKSLERQEMKIGQPYHEMGVPRFIVTGAPVSLTQTVYGSLPRCSVVAPAGRLLGLLPVGKVTGIGEAHELPLAVTCTPVILEADWSQVSLYPQESLAMRAANEADICDPS